MSARDELIAKARDWASNFKGTKSNTQLNSVYYINALADALEAAKPRTITTVEELKTVYAGCLIREAGGDLWSIDGATDRLFMIVDGADDTYDDDILTLPATVLYEATS